MVFWVAPLHLGSYAITTKVRRNNRETTTKVLDLGGFKGKNTEQNRAVPIPEYEHGWRLDLTRKNEIKLNQISADNGRCEGIRWPSVTENGLTMYVRLDQTKHTFPRDASVHCSINLPVYRIVPVDEDGPSKSGRISWASDERRHLGVRSRLVTLAPMVYPSPNGPPPSHRIPRRALPKRTGSSLELLQSQHPDPHLVHEQTFATGILRCLVPRDFAW